MQLDKLQLDLHPRPNAQALDLGFNLLREHASDAYLAWLALWLPVIGLCAALSCIFPRYVPLFIFLAWWVRPMLERAPLYVLSRQVFGENVGWREAVRAWPRQLGGGWFYLLTWGRVFSTGRGLYQPIWQLEGARGRVAAERRKILGRSGTSRASYWFGVACANFEFILQFGLLAFIGIFISDEQTTNPFIMFKKFADESGTPGMGLILLSFAGQALSGAIIGPVFTACGFTLYLNRRATLEAWDIEIALRQIKPPQRRGASGAGQMAAALLVTLCGGALLFGLSTVSPPVAAQESTLAANTTAAKCEPPDFVKNRAKTRTEDQSPEQTGLRSEVAKLYDNDDLRGYTCEAEWKYKYAKDEPNKPRKTQTEKNSPLFNTIAGGVKIALIAILLCAVGALIYRYRGQLAALMRIQPPARATEIAGMDIRPESLPDDVAKRVSELWQQGQRRAALALLYRATVSRLVNDNRLPLSQGATEGDCMRHALQAQRRQELSPDRLYVTRSITDLWLRAAYGDHWPDDVAVISNCAAWRKEFDIATPAGVSQ